MPPSTIQTNPAEPLELIRRARGLSRSQLAELASVHRETIARLERGQNRPQLATLAAIAAALEVDDIRELFSPPAEEERAT